MIWAARRLYEATGERRFLETAERWAADLDKHYWFSGKGGYAMAADDTSDVIVRLAPATDDATPNANAIMLANLPALELLTGKESYATKARDLVNAYAEEIAANPIAHGGMLAGVIDNIAPQLVVIQSGSGQAELRDALHRIALPGASELIVGHNGFDANAYALHGKQPVEARSAAYACLGTKCSLPITDEETFDRQLTTLRRADADAT